MWKMCSSHSNRNTHMLLVHAEEDLKTQKCTLCGKGFVRKCDLTFHLKQCGKSKESLISASDYKCQFCCWRFKIQCNLEKHEIKHKEKPFSCSFCAFRSDRRDTITTHERRRTGEKPFKCNQCENTFKQKQELDIHKRSHTGGKPYACIFCPKRFSQGTHLTTHKKSKHSDIKEICNVCQKCFDKGYLKTHYDLMHASTESRFSCDVCGKDFKQDFYLKRHMKSHNSIGKCVQCSISKHLKGQL